MQMDSITVKVKRARPAGYEATLESFRAKENQHTLYRLVTGTKQTKLGNMPKTYTTRDSCPETCPFIRKNGCFGENFHQKYAWDAVHFSGHDFEQLLDEVAALPMRSQLRINVVGDYKDPVLDIPRYSRVVARKKLAVLNYMHHPLTSEIIGAVKSASYIVNCSTESISRARDYLDWGVNAVIALPSTLEVKKSYRWGDMVIVTCPAQLEKRKKVTCENCMLCALDRVEKRIVVGFLAHGTKKLEIDRAIGLSQ